MGGGCLYLSIWPFQASADSSSKCLPRPHREAQCTDASTTSASLVIVCHCYSSPTWIWRANLLIVLICIFLIVNPAEHFLMCLLAFCVFLEKFLVKSWNETQGLTHTRQNTQPLNNPGLFWPILKLSCLLFWVLLYILDISLWSAIWYILIYI